MFERYKTLKKLLAGRLEKRAAMSLQDLLGQLESNIQTISTSPEQGRLSDMLGLGQMQGQNQIPTFQNMIQKALPSALPGMLTHGMEPSLGIGGTLESAAMRGLGDVTSDLVTMPVHALSKGISKGVEGLVKAPSTTYGYRLNKYLHGGLGGLMDRIEAPDIAAQSFIETAAGDMAHHATDLLADITGKAVSGITDLVAGSPARKALVDQLKKEDPIISQMNPQELMDAYHSISKFAPNLAKDKNAVRSALRMAAQTEGGLSYHVIKGLAEAEQAVNRVKEGSFAKKVGNLLGSTLARKKEQK